MLGDAGGASPAAVSGQPGRVMPPSAWRLFAIWATIGLQSFGGGASTTLLIQRAFIERRGWLTLDEFTRLWNLCLLAPGMNLIAVTVLIGQKFGGARGVLVSVAGLLLPSAGITCLLAALFLRVEGTAATQAILRGVVPATAGIMGVVMVNFALPLIRRRRSGGAFYRWGAIPLVLLCALAIIVGNVSAVLVVLGAALVGILIFAPPAAAAALRSDAGGDAGGDAGSDAGGDAGRERKRDAR